VFCVVNSMASEPEVSENDPMFERLVRDRDLSLLVPFILGFTNPRRNPEPQPQQQQQQEEQQHPDQETENRERPTTPRDRIILIDPFTQGMVVIEGGTASTLDSLIHELGTKDGQPPASKASIEALKDVVVGEDDDDDDSGSECVICLEEWKLGGGVVKEMPCKHKFHASCIEKWLGIHGSCPVCRYKMPVDEDQVGKKRVEREIWVSFSFNSGRRNRESDNQTPTNDSNDSTSSPTRPDHEMEV